MDAWDNAILDGIMMVCSDEVRDALERAQKKCDELGVPFETKINVLTFVLGEKLIHIFASIDKENVEHNVTTCISDMLESWKKVYE